MLSFCLKAWALQKCLPSLGWVKTISFSLIAAELKWRIIYLSSWSMKQNAASVDCVCLRNHKSGGRVYEALGLRADSHFVVWTAQSMRLQHQPLHCHEKGSISCFLAQSSYLFLPHKNMFWIIPLLMLDEKLFYYLLTVIVITEHSGSGSLRCTAVPSYCQPHITPWVCQISSHQHLIAPVGFTHSVKPGVATCSQTFPHWSLQTGSLQSCVNINSSC